MDIFVLSPVTYRPFSLTGESLSGQGDVVSGIESILWVERYNKPGEFIITGDPLKLREQLRIDSLISHQQTNCVMRVETHFIEQDETGTDKIVVTGRDALSIIMENRVVAFSQRDNEDNDNWAPLSTYPEDLRVKMHTSRDSSFYLSEDSIWNHVETLLDRYLIDSDLGVVENLPGVSLVSQLTGYEETYKKTRVVKDLPYLSDVVFSLLKAGDLGLRLERPTPEHADEMQIVIYYGSDLRNSVKFGQNPTDMIKPRYLWSSKNNKRSFYVKSDNVSVRAIDEASHGWYQTMTTVNRCCWHFEYLSGGDEGGDYDGYQQAYPQLLTMGYDEIHGASSAGILDATLSRSANYVYGVDYNLGDMVTLIAKYGIESVMRVSEHAITVDKTGESFIQTLVVPSDVVRTPLEG